MPGNERYYDFVQGSIHFFVVDSDSHEPDGNSSSSRQGNWLRDALAASTSQFDVVYFHHAPYASHGASSFMRWPFEEWGADVVFSGHVHDYERVVVNDLPYFVVGNSGKDQGHTGFGAMRVTQDDSQLTFEFFSVTGGGRLIDTYVLDAPAGPGDPRLSIGNTSLTETDTGSVEAVFTVSLSKTSSEMVTVEYATSDRSAMADGDYVAQIGTVTFDPGVTTQTLAIAVNGDQFIENNETFAVELSNAVEADIADGEGIGTIVDNDTPTQTYYLSLAGSATLRSSNGSQLAVADADIFRLDVPVGGGYQFLPYFDGSDVGLLGSDEDVDAFDVLPDGSIVISTIGPLSVSTNYASPGIGSGATITGTNRDLFKFTPTTLGDNTTGSWSLLLAGAAVGLDTSGENIDSVSVLADGRLLISVTGSASVPGISAKDEDLLALTPATGAWALYFDGSDVGLDSSSEDIDGLFVEPSPSDGLPTLYFTTRDKFSVSGLSGADEDIFRFVPSQLGATTQGAFGSSLALDGSAFGLASPDLDGIHIHSTPPASPSAARLATLGPAVAASQSAPVPVIYTGSGAPSGAPAPASRLQDSRSPSVLRPALAANPRHVDQVFANHSFTKWLAVAVRRPTLVKTPIAREV